MQVRYQDVSRIPVGFVEEDNIGKSDKWYKKMGLSLAM
jgi:hypothetical protein